MKEQIILEGPRKEGMSQMAVEPPNKSNGEIRMEKAAEALIKRRFITREGPNLALTKKGLEAALEKWNSFSDENKLLLSGLIRSSREVNNG